MNRRAASTGITLGAATLVFSRTPRIAARSTNSLQWEEITVDSAHPAARWDHTLSVSDGHKTLMLFGGRDAGGSAFTDTWIFNRLTDEWADRSGEGPSARFGHAVATDQKQGKSWLFGGQSESTFFNDLWEFDFSSEVWSQVDDGSGVAPSPRYGTSMVLADDGQLLVSHGFTIDGRFNDTWEWNMDEGSWIDVSPAADAPRPLNRCLHEAVWDANTSTMLLYGGCSSGYGPCPQDDLWRFSKGEASWVQIVTESAPSGRSNPGLVYDTGRRQSILLCGLGESGYESSAWTLPNSESPEWLAIESSGAGPGARASHDMCVTGPNLYLFGGIGGDGVFDDLWTARLDR